eukprot:scaffold10997_cov216-Amphora_coffeaeformis.AAC.1
MDSDDDISCYSSHSNAFSSPNLRRRPVEEDRKVAGTNSSRKRVKKDDNSGGTSIRLPGSSKSVSKYLTQIKARLKSKPFDTVTSDRIAHAALTLQLEYCKEKVKKEGRKLVPPKVRERVCVVTYAM